MRLLGIIALAGVTVGGSFATSSHRGKAQRDYRLGTTNSMPLQPVGRVPINLPSSTCTFPGSASYPTYVVVFDEKAIRRIHVVATLPMTDDTLRMSSVAASQLPDGWGTFVHDLQAHMGSQPLAVKPLPAGRWLVQPAGPRTVTLTYDVGIAHDSVQWDVSGAWARGYATDGTVFFTGRAVFIGTSAMDSLAAQVRFCLPAGWRVATPYTTLGDTSATYEARNLSDLWGNGTLVGRLAMKEVRTGDLRIVFASGESLRTGMDLYARTFDPIATEYATMLGGAPTGKLVIITNLATGNVAGGESFNESISIFASSAPRLKTRSDWGYTLAHELFHQWNPHAFPPADQTQFEWFVEGFTDYMTRQGMLRAEMISEQDFFDAMAKSYGKYLAVAGARSLRSAGADKGGNYQLIYFGGSSLAAALDVELRRRGGGAVGVPQIMAHLFADFRKTHRPYDYNDLVGLVSTAAGVDMRGFFSRYVDGVDTIPLPADLASIGLSVRPDHPVAKITRVKDAPPDQARVLAALLTR
jgi:predicted metalloprotease with PDZ domain